VATGAVRENRVTSKHIVSIVVPTFNRLPRLQRCIDRIRHNVGHPNEIVVVDGGSTDGTREWLMARMDLRLIFETAREGAVRAFDRGFRAAAGYYVMWLNDDAYPLPGAVEAAVGLLERADLADLGMVAFYHNFDRQWNRLDSVKRDGETYSVYNVRGTPYANFGLLRRELLERLGFLDLRYHFAGWDPDLSLKVQREAGLKVIGCPEALVYHEELIDERKSQDLPVLEADNKRLLEKWDLPSKFSYPDPRPAYRAMLGELAVIPARPD
jgi:GT2 family glycosyltransferase